MCLCRNVAEATALLTIAVSTAPLAVTGAIIYCCGSRPPRAIRCRPLPDSGAQARVSVPISLSDCCWPFNGRSLSLPAALSRLLIVALVAAEVLKLLVIFLRDCATVTNCTSLCANRNSTIDMNGAGRINDKIFSITTQLK